MFQKFVAIGKDTVAGYMADDCLSRGAAIAYYTIFSLAPLLIIATAIAGFFFGDEAVRGSLDDQLRGMVGQEAASSVQAMVKGASNPSSGLIATVIGIVTLLFTASGTFGQLQSSLNAIWKVEAPSDDTATTMQTVSRFMKAKAASIGLVAATGFLLLVSLLASAAISAVSTWIGGLLPGTEIALSVLSFLVSFLLITALFAAIYKVLPDKRMAWKDVGIGALATALLFVIGKSIIGWYLGSGLVGSSFGAASALVVILLWIYYSSQIFLLGAEFTRAYASLEGSHKHAPVPADAEAAPVHRPAPAFAPPMAPRPVMATPHRPLPMSAAMVLAPAIGVRKGPPLWPLVVALAAGGALSYLRRPPGSIGGQVL